MLYSVDTHAAALKLERELALRHAERVAPLIEAAAAPRTVPVTVRVEKAITPQGRLARAVRSLRWVLRPAHAYWKSQCDCAPLTRLPRG